MILPDWLNEPFKMEGQQLTWRQALAWYDPVRAIAVCYPFPFNLVARYTRLAWFWCLGGHGDRWTAQLEAARAEGRQSVWAEVTTRYEDIDRARAEIREHREWQREFESEYGEMLRRIAQT